jgi:hypothetical protein
VVHVVSGHARTANDHIGSLDGDGFMHKSILSAFIYQLVCAGHACDLVGHRFGDRLLVTLRRYVVLTEFEAW